MAGVRSTLVLLVILIGLGSYIYFVDRNRTPSGEEVKEKLFADVKTEDVEEVQIKSADGETSRVQKVDGKWQVVEPITAAADEGELSSITGSLATIDIQRVVDENAANLAEYGLEPARVEVAFRTKGQKEPRRILLGEKTPTGGDLYARLPDQKRVFLVSSFLDSTFNKGTFALRDKTVLAFDRQKVDGLELVNGGTTIELAKSGSEWKIVKPFAARGDFGAIEGAVERLGSVQMQAIVENADTSLAKYGLDKPAATMTVATGSSRATLLLGATENAVIYAKDASRPVVFTLAPTIKDDVLKGVDDFRRRDVFDSRSFTMNRVEIRRGADTIVLEKTKGKDPSTALGAGGDTWQKNGAAVDTAKADELLTKLSSMRAESFETSPHPSLKAPAMTVVVRFDQSKTETITFGRSSADVFAGRPDEPGSIKVDPTAFEDVIKALDALK